MNDEDFIAKMSTLHHRFWLQADAERLLALANALEAKCAALEAELHGIAEYRAANPLGGPAKVFDAIASRIRAGEEYYSVLADNGVTIK